MTDIEFYSWVGAAIAAFALVTKGIIRYYKWRAGNPIK
jgi:hypothetical protein